MGNMLLARIGVAEPMNKKIFWRAVWGKDIRAKSRRHLEKDAQEFFEILATPPYGVFDAFVRVVGLSAAIEVCKGHTLIRPEHQAAASPFHHLRRRGSSYSGLWSESQATSPLAR